jgi:hypothetical protein
MARKKDYGFKVWEKVLEHPDGKHVRITNNMMESKAWKQLTPHAVQLYLYMKSKYNKNNENDISCTYAEGEKLMSKLTFTKALDQLIEHGFIKVIRQSWTSRECNIYGFHFMWQNFGTDKFTVRPRKKRQSNTEKNG